MYNCAMAPMLTTSGASPIALAIRDLVRLYDEEEEQSPLEMQDYQTDLTLLRVTWAKFENWLSNAEVILAGTRDSSNGSRFGESELNGLIDGIGRVRAALALSRTSR